LRAPDLGPSPSYVVNLSAAVTF